MPKKKLYGAAAASVEKKAKTRKEREAAFFDTHALVETGENKYENVRVESTESALKRVRKESRAKKRKQERDEAYMALMTEQPSPADYAVAALIRGRAAIAKAVTPGDLKKEKIDPEDAMRIQRTRTDRAMKQDRCQQNKRKVTQPDLDWVLKPGHKDVPGIDAPGYCYKRKDGTVVCVQKKKSKFPKTCGAKKR